MIKSTALFIFLSLTFTVSIAQSKRNKKQQEASEVQTANTQPTALSPTEQKRVYAPKASRKKSSPGPTYSAEARYYERMEKLERAKEKEEKIKAKPQYSDPMYFGHKRKPKKSKPGKMKFCKECGIRH